MLRSGATDSIENPMKKKIIGITGCRSEYDIIYSVLKEMQKDESFDVSLIVCGAHLSGNFGYTVSEIERDGFLIADRIHNLVDSDLEAGKAKGAGILMMGLSDSLDRIQPDFAMVVGDREEAIVTGIVCTYLGIPLIHLCGGDHTEPRTGDVDEPVRHATSKLANLHFVMNEDHKERLIRMGEEHWRVHNTGNPALDRFKEIESMDKKEILRYFQFNNEKDMEKPLILVIQHVISGEVTDGARQIENTLEATTGLESNCIINYPNSDMGSRRMIDIIENYRKLPNVRVTRNIPRKEFVNLLRNIDLLVGNSSMALLEGSFLKVPAINVGERNRDRMNGGNVVFVEADTSKIEEMVRKILLDKDYRECLMNCKLVYGDGTASQRIVGQIKASHRPKSELITKNITY
jgi:GDP/UDP-N,N'-diacetylbacillosamine 2-epimerase (hydrolysing)